MTDSKETVVSTEDFNDLITKAKKELGINDEDIANLPTIQKIINDGKRFRIKDFGVLFAGLTFLLIFALPCYLVLNVQRQTTFGKYAAEQYFQFTDDGEGKLEDESCLVRAPEFVADKFRTPIDCSECKNVKGIKRVKRLSPQDFLDHYAFSMQPVLIEDGQDNWTASNVFDFDYFKNVYSDEEALKKVDKDCQFFPYQTEFSTLGEFFNMSKDRVEGKESPWYVGWSNCDGKTANQLRQHYKTPYFLPPELDHSNTDWVFMGLPGYGAHLHIDNVGTLSWQAQVKGTKKWTLESPPECYWECINEMEIIVKPGEIIVLDTNKWFHATEIIGKETSIVIGSEYF